MEQFEAELKRFKAIPRTRREVFAWEGEFWRNKAQLERIARRSGLPVVETRSDSKRDEDAGPSIMTPQSPPSKVTTKAVEELDARQDNEAKRVPDVGSAASAAGGKDFSEETAASAVDPNAGPVLLTPHQATGGEGEIASDSTMMSPSAGGQEGEAAEEQAEEQRESTTGVPYFQPVQASGALPSALDVEVDVDSPTEERWVDASPYIPGSWPEAVVSSEASVTTSIGELAGMVPSSSRLMDGAMGMLKRYPFALVILAMFLLSACISLWEWWELLEERNRWVAANTVPPSYGPLASRNPVPSLFWQLTWGYKPRWALILHFRIVEYLNGDRWWPIPEPEWLP